MRRRKFSRRPERTFASRHGRCRGGLLLVADNLHGYGSAGFGIGQSMVVACQVVSTAGSDGMQPMVGQLLTEEAARCPASTEEAIAGIGHTIIVMHGPQTPLVERAVVSHQRQAFDERGYLAPHDGKDVGPVGIGRRKTVNGRRKRQIVVGYRMYEPVHGIGYHSVAHDNDTHACNAGAPVVGGLKIYGCKIFHGQHSCSAGRKRQSIKAGISERGPSACVATAAPGREKTDIFKGQPPRVEGCKPRVATAQCHITEGQSVDILQRHQLPAVGIDAFQQHLCNGRLGYADGFEQLLAPLDNNVAGRNAAVKTVSEV